MSTKKDEVNKNEPNKDYKKTTTIIETTYEKVLSIINKVKEFIKKNSSNAQDLVEDLDWVIKVITNKSLYTYELQKEKLSKQNAEYKTFINFVTKYNEEVIEMNKRHDIVSSIFNLGRKRFEKCGRRKRMGKNRKTKKFYQCFRESNFKLVSSRNGKKKEKKL